MVGSLLRGIMCTVTLLASGCGFSGQPSIAVDSVAVTDLGEEFVGVDIALSLSNGGTHAIRLVEFTYDVVADGVLVYHGRHAPGNTLPPKATVATQIPAVLPANDGPMSWYVVGHVVYVSPSALAQTLLDSGVATPTAAFEGRGTLAPTTGETPQG